jgi:hypothetical protein
MSFSGYRDAAAGVRRGHAGGVPSVIRPRAHGSRRSCEPRLRVGRSCRGEYGRPVGGGDGGWLTAPMGGQPLRSQVVRRAEVGCGDRRGAWLLLGSTVDRRVWSRYCRARGGARAAPPEAAGEMVPGLERPRFSWAGAYRASGCGLATRRRDGSRTTRPLLRARRGRRSRGPSRSSS